MTCRSTWGDPHYVGLAGIECFDEDGDIISFSDPTADITANPHSINVLPVSCFFIGLFCLSTGVYIIK